MGSEDAIETNYVFFDGDNLLSTSLLYVTILAVRFYCEDIIDAFELDLEFAVIFS